MKRLVLVLLVVGTILGVVALRADEGMWMPQQIPQLAARLSGMGFKGDPKAFADLTGQPMGAVVSLGGCTASFVSPDGLIVTNHHCVTGALQFNSTPQRDLLANGFLAKTRDEELSNGPGSHLFVTTRVTEVTDAITGSLAPDLTDRQRYEAIDRRVKERIAACEKPGVRCTVPSFFEGLKYFEIEQLDIPDVRLVYAPAEGIGVFGGETDNWRWPRHTGDWGFLRAYVGKDGKPAPYSKDNVPFKPKHWLPVAPEGVKADDLVFVVGYPGRTQRHQTYGEVKATVEWAMPRSIRLAEEQLAILDRLSKDKALAIKVAGRVQGLNNGLTNTKGVREGMIKGGSLERKQAQEKELADWIAADASRKQKYGDVLPALQSLQETSVATRERNATLGLLASASSYLGSAQTLYRLSVQRAKPDLERDPGFQERDWVRIREGQDRLQRTIDPAVDRALFSWALGKAAALPASQRIEPLDTEAGLRAGMSEAEAQAAIAQYLDRLYAGTKLADAATRIGLLDKTTAQVTASGDTFIALAAALEPLNESVREAAKNLSGAYAKLRPRYMEALLARAGGLVAPDANSTLRVTFGQVKGVRAKDGLLYEPFTTLEGILEKHTGEGDFNAPKAELDAIAAEQRAHASPYAVPGLKSVPVNFLSTVDTTGGNSGSPTLNAKGELVGLLFDGTYESVASDYLFEPVKTRSIHVDSRYMLWTMTAVDGASHLVKEMGVVK